MEKYETKNGIFLVHDFQKAKKFCSFLPAVAGVDGRPLWAFYASVGQAMGGFGSTSKDTPIAPFDSANLAYGNIPIKGFRTFIRSDDGVLDTPFFKPHPSQTLWMTPYECGISEKGKRYEMKVCYFTVAHEDFPALVRLVEITNVSDKGHEAEILDGLPVMFPYGLSNVDYKELPSLMAAYCVVENLEAKAPFIKFKTSTKDASAVYIAKEGNAFCSVNEDGSFAQCVVDPALVFADDLSYLEPLAFLEGKPGDLSTALGQTENKIPCAFSYRKVSLKAGENIRFATIYGQFDDLAHFKRSYSKFDYAYVLEKEKENKELISDLLSVAKVKTAYSKLDEAVAQSYLDNSLRGGFPLLLDNGNGGTPYYVYGRKHGDMERDYNAFNIPASYYSSGPGNFRDVNQNRRSDLFFAPFLKDYNIKIFFNLIQVDGQNPLNVKPLSFFLGKEDLDKALPDLEESIKKEILSKVPYFPGDMYSSLRKMLFKEVADKVFSKVLGASSQRSEADFAEGYWVDHWTYNLDLLENYSSVYPDQEENLLFDTVYRYFYSPVYVEPRSQKHVLLPNGTIRQYGALDLKSMKRECEKKGIDIRKTSYLKDEEGNEVLTSLASKIFNLILVKFSTLDSYQMGIEMECEKPGWNDAMNGLPGLFGSGLSETVELLRLVRYASERFAAFKNHDLLMMKGQMDLYEGLSVLAQALEEGKISRFEYWDKATAVREELRLRYKEKGEKANVSLACEDVLGLLKAMDHILSDGLRRAKEAGNGILPSYLIYEPTDYELTGKKNHLGYEAVRIKGFSLVKIPAFLEASARALKLSDGLIDEESLEAIKKTEIYDKKLHFYKTCEDIEDAPFEIGRVHAFTKGWLERECNFLHMDYKFLLGLLRAGYYERFYQECKTNLVPFMDPNVYGRNPAEASSFIVPSVNPDPSKHGQGFFARLTGANAEMLDMFVRSVVGDHIFCYDGKTLRLGLSPKLPASIFDENDEVSFVLFGKTSVTYHNPKRLDLYKGGYSLSYVLDGKALNGIEGENAIALREGRFSTLRVEIS